MNKKGFTLVELLASFVLSMIIVIILFQLILNLKDVYLSSGLKTELLNKQNLMVNKIYTDLLDTKVFSITDCEDTNICVNFLFNDGTNKKLIVDQSDGTLSYDDYSIKLDNNSYFNNIYINTKESAVTNNAYNRMFYINIPIYNDLFPDTDFGVNIVYMYDTNLVSNNFDDFYSLHAYENIPFIYANGNQYIDLGYAAKKNTEVQLDVQFIENENTYNDSAVGHIIAKSKRNDSNTFQANFDLNTRTINYWLDKISTAGGQYQSMTYTSVTKRSTMILKSGSVTFQGSTIAASTKTEDNVDGMMLLGTYTGGKKVAFNRYDSKVYGFKILEGTTLIRDMIPVRRKSDGVVGLYDKVNDVFYRSDSGTDFIYDMEYENIDYVYANGNQYINLEYNANKNTEVQLDVQFIENENTYNDSAVGYIIAKSTRNDSNTFQANFDSTPRTIYYWLDKISTAGGQFQSMTYTSVTKRSTMILKSGSVTFQGSTIAASTKTEDNVDGMMLLGTYTGGKKVAFNRYDSKVYGFKILEGTTLIRDMISVRRKSDGVVGLYDKVNDVFYRSDSGTDFIYDEV